MKNLQEKVAAAAAALRAVSVKNQGERDNAGEELKRAAAVVRDAAAKQKDECAPLREQLANISHRWKNILGDLPVLIDAIKQKCIRWDEKAAERREERTGEAQAVEQAGKGGALQNSYAIQKTFRIGDKGKGDFAACIQRIAHVVPPPNGEIVGEKEWDAWGKQVKEHLKACVGGTQDFPAGASPAEKRVFRI